MSQWVTEIGRACRIATLWGFAEAVAFFVVPDVWIGRVALHGRRPALLCAAWATAGALAGGLLVYVGGMRQEAALLHLYDQLPAIGTALIGRVRSGLELHPVTALLTGGFSGAPYKLYAAQAAHAGMPWWGFMLASVIARSARFVLVAVIVSACARWLSRYHDARRLRLGWWTLCALFYVLYWALMPS